jgi:NADH-quinone oxidoreductase subunit H
LIGVWLALFQIVIFPGFLFLGALSLVFEYVDRKLYARMQNRIGPPWYQPLADLLKLLSKETIVPCDADPRLFGAIPVFALAATCAAFLYIPIWSLKSLMPFDSDLIVVMYFLTIPTLTYFLAGWFSSSLFAELGAIRAMTQLFAYEVPLYMALLGPALLAGTWSISGISLFYHQHPALLLVNIPALLVSIVTAQGKLERAPFDIPDAETEIVGGTFTEYSGRLLAMFKMTLNTELVVVAALISAIFFPLFIGGSAVVGFLLFLVKLLVVVFLLSLMRAALARFRMDQMVDFCWKVLAPVALAQILIDLIVKGALL